MRILCVPFDPNVKSCTYLLGDHVPDGCVVEVQTHWLEFSCMLQFDHTAPSGHEKAQEMIHGTEAREWVIAGSLNSP